MGRSRRGPNIGVQWAGSAAIAPVAAIMRADGGANGKSAGAAMLNSSL